MSKKMSFPEPGCYDCPNHCIQGTPSFGTRLCKGGKWKSRGKRFRSSEPAYKAPKWCPRRLAVPVCRIYGFADEMSQFMEIEWLLRSKESKRDYMPSAFHYKLRAEIPLGMKAKTFYEAAQEQPLEQIIPDLPIDTGEVLEIDDGLKPYFFVKMGFCEVKPVYLFMVEQIKNEVNSIGSKKGKPATPPGLAR